MLDIPIHKRKTGGNQACLNHVAVRYYVLVSVALCVNLNQTSTRRLGVCFSGFLRVAHGIFQVVVLGVIHRTK